MAYVTNEARQELLAGIADAIDELGAALAALGAAYELLDENAADRLEEHLFRPVQVAYGRLQRTHSGFAQRHRLDDRAFAAGTAGRVSKGIAAFLDDAVESVLQSDDILADLQDSMAPVEVGDAELRAGLADVRGILGPLSQQAHEVARSFGR